MHIFGAKGVLLIPVLAAAGLVAFFHSELNALIDVAIGHDTYTVKINSLGPTDAARHAVSQ